jgi:hypothetical protein
MIVRVTKVNNKQKCVGDTNKRKEELIFLVGTWYILKFRFL